eukprot:TRINITY_DN21346_c0_g1_i2.p1 TRINITY_DN21346_c0_g1~~TRINITY_DN21346_c0_g1_i2.p1  ORF type:complete len:217 (+),score=46.40 TRINITY_DN21346_c0_g1_i2:59-652(+)
MSEWYLNLKQKIADVKICNRYDRVQSEMELEVAAPVPIRQNYLQDQDSTPIDQSSQAPSEYYMHFLFESPHFITTKISTSWAMVVYVLITSCFTFNPNRKFYSVFAFVTDPVLFQEVTVRASVLFATHVISGLLCWWYLKRTHSNTIMLDHVYATIDNFFLMWRPLIAGLSLGTIVILGQMLEHNAIVYFLSSVSLT